MLFCSDTCTGKDQEREQHMIDVTAELMLNYHDTLKNEILHNGGKDGFDNTVPILPERLRQRHWRSDRSGESSLSSRMISAGARGSSVLRC